MTAGEILSEFHAFICPQHQTTCIGLADHEYATDEALAKISALIKTRDKKIENMARIDELENLPWKRSDRYGINTPYVTKTWLLERKAELNSNTTKGGE